MTNIVSDFKYKSLGFLSFPQNKEFEEIVQCFVWCRVEIYPPLLDIIICVCMMIPITFIHNVKPHQTV